MLGKSWIPDARRCDDSGVTLLDGVTKMLEDEFLRRYGGLSPSERALIDQVISFLTRAAPTGDQSERRPQPDLGAQGPCSDQAREPEAPHQAEDTP